MFSITKSRNKDKNQVMVIFKGVKYGAFAGFIATWSLSSVIIVTELLLGLPIGAFYSIMGISLGIDDVTVNVTAFGLHLLIGTIIGAAFGVIGIRWKKVRMLNPVQEFTGWHGSGYDSMACIIFTNNRVLS